MPVAVAGENDEARALLLLPRRRGLLGGGQTSSCCRSPAVRPRRLGWARLPPHLVPLAVGGCIMPCRPPPMRGRAAFLRLGSVRTQAGRTNMDVPDPIGVMLRSPVSSARTRAWIGGRARVFRSWRAHAALLPADRPRISAAGFREARRATPTVSYARAYEAERPGDRGRRHRLTSPARRRRSHRVTFCWWRPENGWLSRRRGERWPHGASTAALVSGESPPQSVGTGRTRCPPAWSTPAPGSGIQRHAACGDRTFAGRNRPPDRRIVPNTARSRFVAPRRPGSAPAPVVHVTALLTFVGWMMLGDPARDRAPS